MLDIMIYYCILCILLCMQLPTSKLDVERSSRFGNLTDITYSWFCLVTFGLLLGTSALL